MRPAQKLAIASVTIALSFATVGAKPTQAAILNYNFTVNIDAASSIMPGAMGSGSFSFDDSSLNTSGSATVESLNFGFNGDSSVYTANDDIGYLNSPTVFSTTSFSGGKSVGLNYDFLNKANPASSVEFQVAGDYFAIFSNTSSDIQIGSGRVSYREVPEPATVSGVLAAGGIGWLMKKKTAASQKAKV